MYTGYASLLVGTCNTDRLPVPGVQIVGSGAKLKGARKNNSEGEGEVRERTSTSLPSPPLLFIAFFTSAPLSTIWTLGTGYWSLTLKPGFYSSIIRNTVRNAVNAWLHISIYCCPSSSLFVKLLKTRGKSNGGLRCSRMCRSKLGGVV